MIIFAVTWKMSCMISDKEIDYLTTQLGKNQTMSLFKKMLKKLTRTNPVPCARHESASNFLSQLSAYWWYRGGQKHQGVNYYVKLKLIIIDIS